MKIKIEIKIDNEAFEDPNGRETARILHRLAGKLEMLNWKAGESGPLRDINGNNVGTWEVTE